LKPISVGASGLSIFDHVTFSALLCMMLLRISKPGRMHERTETWNEASPEGRWRCFDYDELLKRDKLSLDLFWIKDKSLTDTDTLPDDVLDFFVGHLVDVDLTRQPAA
jgi:hypothetical protein